MPEWTRVKLGELATIAHGYAFKGEYFSDTGPGERLLTPGNFARGGGFQEGKPKYYTGPVSEEFRLNAGDLVVTMTDLSRSGDTLGYPALIPPRPIYLHNQRVGRFRILRDDLLMQKYLYYALRVDSYRSHVLAGATGSTVKHTSPSRILDYQITLPSIQEQRMTTEVLGALDDKIAVNERIIATIEHLLNTHFSLSMEGVHRTVQLGAIVDFHYGKALKEENRTVGNVPVFGGNGISGWHNTPLVNGPGVIVGRKGANAGSVSWSQCDFWPIDTSFFIRARTDLPIEFVYFLLEGAGLRRLVGDSAIPGLSREIALRCEVALPGVEAIHSFASLARITLDLIDKKAGENRTLAELRDTLLPKLISGELRIRDAERHVGDVV
jgi:type I restriction enzyme, S subunit